MKVGAFEIGDPAPELHDTLAIALLTPWVDVGDVGTLVLSKLERHFGAQELGRLSRPGAFFDFTRDRPRVSLVEGRRLTTVPNMIVNYAREEGARDYLFLHIREPHANGEDYVDAIVALLRHFNVTEYCRIGGFYDSVPHTRPLMITATLTDSQAERAEGLVSTRGSRYQGPTSIVNLVNDTLTDQDVSTTGLMVHLPHYAPLEEDHLGASRLMEVLCSMYGFPGSLADQGKAQQQYEAIGRLVERDPQAASHVRRLEAEYDKPEPGPQTDITMAPDVENFLREMSKRLEDGTDQD
jgi:hypothetical protein